MKGTNLAEWLLCRTTTREIAATQLGDLLELAQTRSPLWFWTNILTTVAYAAFRPTLAFLIAFAFSKLTEYLWNHGLFGNRPDLNSFDTTGALFFVPLTLLPVYSLVRYGLRDAFALQSAVFALLLSLITAFILSLDPHPGLLWIAPILILITVTCIRLGRRWARLRPLAQLSTGLTINWLGGIGCMVVISLSCVAIESLFHVSMLTYRLMTALATHPFGDLFNGALCIFLVRTANRIHPQLSTPTPYPLSRTP